MPPTETSRTDLADRDLLIEAAHAAAPVAMASFRLGKAPKSETWDKSDGSIVTETDLAVNNALREVLMGARPGYGWLSEEDADDPERLTQDALFVVDPIDGTRSFAEGKPEFCFSVAVVRDGRPSAAVIFAPALERLFDAVDGGAARLNGADLAPERREKLAGARFLGTKSTFKPQRWPGGAPEVSIKYVHPIAYRLCLVAEGGWDGMASLGGTNEWDVAAGDLIARQAGAVVSEPDGTPFRFNKPTPRIAGTLAAGPEIHADLVARLAPRV